MAPAPRIPAWKLRTKTGGTVKGVPERAGQRPPTVAEVVRARAKARADANAKKKPPSDNPAGPRKSTGSILEPEKPGMDKGRYGGGSRGNPYDPPKPGGGPKKTNLSVRDPRSQYQGGDGHRPANHPEWGKPGPGVDKQSQLSRQREDREKGKKTSKPIPTNQTPGLIRTDARPDAFGDRNQFEKDRQEWARQHPDNKGNQDPKDRVPTYTPGKGSRPIIPDPKKKKIPSPNSGVVRGLVH